MWTDVIPDRALTTDKRSDSTQVLHSEPISLLGLPTGTWGKGTYKSKVTLRQLHYQKAHSGMGDCSWKLNP